MYKSPDITSTLLSVFVLICIDTKTTPSLLQQYKRCNGED